MQIFENNYIVKDKAEDNLCSLQNLLYKFNWSYYTWKYLKVAAGSYSIPAWCQKP